MKNKKGFAVIEMIVIMSIIGLLTTAIMKQPEKTDEQNKIVNLEKQ